MNNTEKSTGSQGQLGPVRVWALAAGGMVGGGIYIALGVVIAVAAQWAWLSFVISGVIAVCTAYSYARVSNHYERSGGAFEFLEEMDRQGIAGSLSWLLILGYTLTIAVYTFAFGHYLAYSIGGGPAVIRASAIGIGIALIGLNLVGIGKMTAVEVVIVTANLVVLLVLGLIGICNWDSTQLLAGIEPRTPWSASVGAAAIFVSYEGFQLLTYEYEKVKSPEKYFLPVLVSAAIFVVFVYVLVALGATMLAGALAIVEEKQVALSIAAENVGGTAGLVVMTIAAAFATAAAINSTLFSTGKLAARVARDHELPGWFSHQNRFGVPDRPIIVIGIVATLLSVLGSLSALVEAASLVFLAAFFIVNLTCFQLADSNRWIPLTGIIVGAMIGVVLVARLIVTAPISLAVLVLLSLVATLGRSAILRRLTSKEV
ncbi:APC family permease [Bremerella sp. JC817]|uniref:APC family permease n=1 Tax=Bremerella sp. JC817 TaxID=3231756 RepID=UPI00345B377C